MAIFSSSKKKKDAASGGSTNSPPLNSSQGPSLGAQFGRSPSSGTLGNSGATYGGAGSGIPVSSSSSLLQQSAPTTQPSPLPPGAQQQLSSSLPASSPPPTTTTSGHTVLYPWSQRKLSYLPSVLLSPTGEFLPGPPSFPPFPRYGHSVNPTASLPNGDLYIFGGLVANAVKNDLYVLSCSSAGTQGSLSVGLVETRGEVPGPRVGHASVGVGNVLIVWGGDTKSRPEDRQDDSLYLLNLSTREWTRVKTTGPAPEGRYGHAAAMVGSRFFIFGGQKDDGGFMNDLVWFDLQKLKAGAPKWTSIDYAPTAIVPPKRTGHTAVTHGDCIYIFGGTDGQYHYNDTWCYDTAAQTWTELSCIGYIPVPREGHAATLVDDVMYVFGGRGVDGKDLEDLAAFKIGNQRWFMFQNMGPAPSGRSGHAMATWQNKVYVLGGESYTSTRADDPSFVHVLDTSKIKYPQDSTRQSGSRKSSVPMVSPPPRVASPPLTSSQQPPFPPATTTIPQVQVHPPSVAPPTGGSEIRQPQPPPTTEESDERRSASPTNRSNGVVLPPPSFGQVLEQQPTTPPPTTTKGNPIVIAQQQQVPSSKIAKRITTTGTTSPPPPVRPPRPGDDQALADAAALRRTTIDAALASSRSGGGEERTMSPTGQPKLRSGTVSPTMSNASSGVSATPLRPRNTGGSPPSASAAQFASAPPRERGAWSPTNVNGKPPGSVESHDADVSQDSFGPSSPPPPPQDAFYYGSKPPLATSTAVNGRAPSPNQLDVLKGKDEEINALKAREKWFRTALALASKKGFVLPPGGEGEGVGLEGLEEGGNRQVVQALVQMKQELGKAKAALADQAQSVDERVNATSRARTAALQEASYYRAKLAALESGSLSEASRLEKERSKDLEHKLTEALANKSLLEHQVEKLQGDIEHHSEMRSSVEERHTAALNRADAAETSYSRSLTDYADLQRRAQSHEAMVQDQLGELAALKASVQVLTAENGRLKEHVDTANSAVDHHVRVVEETQLALAAAHVRNDETHSVWTKLQSELADHQTRAVQLQAELDTKNAESVAATAKAADLERILKATRDEHEATRVLAAGGLATLLASHRDAKPRDLPAEVHVERMHALEEESATVRQLHQDAHARANNTLAELQEARGREVALQAQIAQLRSEIAALRSQHSQSLDEASRHKSAAIDRDGEVREALRAREAAEVKVGLLRNIMADHGLVTSDEDLAARFPPMSGNESPEQLHRRVQDLEIQLERRTRAHSELEAAHEDVRRELQDTEQRYREVAGQHQASEAQLETLRAGSAATSPEDVVRAARAEEELASLQGRHQQLEQTHTRAIAYVKGTEKMLRRMKEELTRYKERNEELEAEVGERGAHGDLRAELGVVRTQLRDLGETSARASQENENLQQRLVTLQAEYERRLQTHSMETESKVHELETELTALDRDLEKARHDLGESLAVNHELQTALKSGTTASGEADTKRLEQELAAAQSKADWFKRENANLEKRCEIAEQKIHILLDHMEGASGDNFEGSPDVDHAGVFETEPWKQGHSNNVSDGGSDYSQNDRFSNGATASVAGVNHR